jgi:hypothetical protein
MQSNNIVQFIFSVSMASEVGDGRDRDVIGSNTDGYH